jgi:hypothetical protein
MGLGYECKRKKRLRLAEQKLLKDAEAAEANRLRRAKEASYQLDLQHQSDLYLAYRWYNDLPPKPSRLLPPWPEPRIFLPSINLNNPPKVKPMAPKYKQNDILQEGRVDAVRETKWAYDGTTTFSYLVRPASNNAKFYKNLNDAADAKWYDEKELHTLAPRSKFNVGDYVEYGCAEYKVNSKTWYESYGKWYYKLSYSLGVWENELQKSKPKPLFAKGDVVLRKNTYALYTVVRANWGGVAGYSEWKYLLDTGNWYWEKDLSKFTPANAKFAIGEVVESNNSYNNKGPSAVRFVKFSAKAKGWLYELNDGRKFFEASLKTLKPEAIIYQGNAYGSSPCQHFRETEFVEMAGKRTMAKNSFCPDCGTRIR